MIELLVVVLIIGILAAIAIPLFLTQKTKANDAAAKSQARTGETAAETYSIDHGGTYAGMEAKSLEEVEPTLKDKAAAEFKVEKAVGGEYEVSSKSVASGDVYNIKRSSEGAIQRTCTTPSKKAAGGCPVSGSW